MKSKVSSLLLTGLIVFFGIVAWAGQGQTRKNPVWEHTVITEFSDNSATLNRLGTEGWELVAVRPEEIVNGPHRQIKLHYYLKRQR